MFDGGKAREITGWGEEQAGDDENPDQSGGHETAEFRAGGEFRFFPGAKLGQDGIVAFVDGPDAFGNRGGFDFFL